jgi:nitrite reductase/ring-hydroxylating ferredoxin subunit
MQLAESLDRLENATRLDRVTVPVRTAVQRLLRRRGLRNALHGVWIGHPLHPALVQLPVGAFLSAAILDLQPGGDRPARLLIGTGLAAAGPAAVTGLADWSQLHEQQQRVGLVHAAANTTGLACYAASLAARRRGSGVAGRVLAYGGLGALTLGAYIGGHLSYRQAGGANAAEAVPHLVPAGWQDLCAVDDLPHDGTPHRIMLDTVPLLVVRQGEAIDVLSDRCSHLAGPLHEGELSEDGSCITCPWHGSVFRLRDGSVVQGPATAPQHSFDVRVTAGRVEVRLPGAG